MRMLNIFLNITKWDLLRQDKSDWHSERVCRIMLYLLPFSIEWLIIWKLKQLQSINILLSNKVRYSLTLFLMLVLLRRTSFLTTFYGLYFSSLHIISQISWWAMYCFNSVVVTCGHSSGFCLHVTCWIPHMYNVWQSILPPPWGSNIITLVFW